MDELQPVSSAETVVLSEHVDYWNRIGWTDPYSSRQYADRQQTYANRLRLEEVYTPQMVVDGVTEFVGSNEGRAKLAIERAAQVPKPAVHVALLPADSANSQTLRVQVSIDALPSSATKARAIVYLVLAENQATSQVLRGENAGRRLHHVAVARSLEEIGKIEPGTRFSKVQLVALAKGISPHNVRLIAFVQEQNQGRVLATGQTKAE